MTAFIPHLVTGSFLAKATPTTTCTKRATASTPKMTANWPDDPAPAYSKYLSFIPTDRLNKAPMIIINKFPSEEYNNVSCRLSYLEADEGAGNSLKAGIDIYEEPAPSPSLYSKYYDPATLHEAPVISIYGDADEGSKKEIFVQMQETPLRISQGREILEGSEPDPSLYLFRYGDRVNRAPDVQLNYNTNDFDSSVFMDYTVTPLQTATAAQILAKYRST